MSLTLDKVAARCRAAPAGREAAYDAEHWIRTSLEGALREHLGPSLDRLSGAHIIRRLDVRVRFTKGQWSESRLLNELCRAFADALFRALANPAGGTNANRVHFADALEWKAQMLRWLNSNTPSEPWRFDLPPEVANLDLRVSTLLLLLEEPGEVASLLRRLQTMGTLAQLAERWDEEELERIFRAVAEHTRLPSDVDAGGDAAILLLTLALALPPPAGKAFASRHHALLVYAASGESALPPRDIFHLFTAARWLLEDPRAARLPRGWNESAAGLPAPVLAWHSALRSLPAERWQPLVAKLAQHLPASVPMPEEESAQLTSRHAGVFLLCRPVLDLRWHEALREMDDRIFQTLLGLVFERALDPVHLDRLMLDPSASLAAGLGAAPSMHDLRSLLAHVDIERVAALWQVSEAVDLQSVIELAANKLLLALGARLRGFRHATAEAIARSFVRVPGRMEITDQRIRVILDAMPFSIALRLSGCDGVQPRLPWLPGIEVDVLLEGL
jgi:hypothetical protein